LFDEPNIDANRSHIQETFMSMTETKLQRIDTLISDKNLLDHPFYQTWTRGELGVESLRDYAVQYAKHVDAFPRYLSALHSHTESASTRRHILENLNDEEAGSPNHPELWIQFAEGIGVPEEQVSVTAIQGETRALIDHFLRVCRSGRIAEGLAALYAYESQIPDVSRSKIDGLVQHYGITDDTVYEYFTVHEEADVEHSRIERQLLGEYLNDENFEAVLAAVQSTLDRLYDFLDGVCERHGIILAA
jgi:pyrroloquinoline-quinone synthase